MAEQKAKENGIATYCECSTKERKGVRKAWKNLYDQIFMKLALEDYEMGNIYIAEN